MLSFKATQWSSGDTSVIRMISRSLSFLDDVSARCGDLQRQPAAEWLGLHPVVQHAGDRTPGMENSSPFAQALTIMWFLHISQHPSGPEVERKVT